MTTPVQIPAQRQEPPGHQGWMEPVPDCGEETYRGSGRLAGKKALITGADSGIGRAVAIAYAREGADVAIAYLNEDADAEATAALVEEAGQRSLLLPGDLAEPGLAAELVQRTVDELGGLDVLVCNAAYQMAHESIAEVSDEEWDRTFDVNIGAMFRLVKAALPHLREGSAIIGSSSVNSDAPNPTLAPYAATKAAIANFCASLAQELGPRGIRVNSVAPGPVWTPLIPSSFPEEKVEGFGSDTPLGRAAQPAELAPAYVLLASDEASYMSGARVAVTGGRPIL
ncbi:SDR family oxidoreductase [Nocardioides jiangxiensis]|uniref:SDR family oxidoreductase n=1 Tax=Nocardioides jiangxiensis TaxID=3064524 RepID=A0ABT9AYB3_9ACTN|nr:SDR family oxidoreductase [Nocardioides sp. WY-20]MDO7866954.1 SDR family oxidoreductase [Nocardioides sp. WY-20]